jgi:hypothetical protein
MAGRPRNTLPTVGEYLEATGQTRETLRERLQLAGIEVSADRTRPSRQLSPAWADVLGIAPDPGAPGDGSPGADGTGSPPPGRSGERPPSEPPGAKQAPLPVQVGQLAAERIAQTYSFVGAGASMATGLPQVAAVFDAYSPTIGAAWVKAAEENEFARRVVTLMSAGGATGELVMAHVVLVGGLLYVSGRADTLGGLYGQRFGPPPPRIVAEPRAGDAAAGDSVADAPSQAAA